MDDKKAIVRAKAFSIIWNTVAKTFIPLVIGGAAVWLGTAFPAKETVEYVNAGEKIIEVTPSLPGQLAPMLLTAAAGFLNASDFIGDKNDKNDPYN